MSKFAFRGDEDTRSQSDWKSVAEQEGHTAIEGDGRPNATSAARKYSEGGKRTHIQYPSGKGLVFEDGLVAHRYKGN